MQLIAVGQAPVGVIAIGQVPTGVIAIGQLATGVIAIGQLSRGVIVVGQLALGVLAFGQLAVGVGWAGGMLAVGGVKGPALLGYGGFGQLELRALLKAKFDRFERRQGRTALAGLITAVAAALVWFAAISPMIEEFEHHDDPTEIEGPPVLR